MANDNKPWLSSIFIYLPYQSHSLSHIRQQSYVTIHQSTGVRMGGTGEHFMPSFKTVLCFVLVFAPMN